MQAREWKKPDGDGFPDGFYEGGGLYDDDAADDCGREEEEEEEDDEPRNEHRKEHRTESRTERENGHSNGQEKEQQKERNGHLLRDGRGRVFSHSPLRYWLMENAADGRRLSADRLLHLSKMEYLTWLARGQGPRKRGFTARELARVARITPWAAWREIRWAAEGGLVRHVPGGRPDAWEFVPPLYTKEDADREPAQAARKLMLRRSQWSNERYLALYNDLVRALLEAGASALVVIVYHVILFGANETGKRNGQPAGQFFGFRELVKRSPSGETQVKAALGWLQAEHWIEVKVKAHEPGSGSQPVNVYVPLVMPEGRQR
jgi:hypothetical protein